MRLNFFQPDQQFGTLRYAQAAMVLCITLQLGSNGLVFAQQVPGDCGALSGPGQFGPFDYRPEGHRASTGAGSYKSLLAIVENHHFTPEVEVLIRGKSGGIGSDIDYTLRAFPNHHRALMSMVALGKKENTDKPRGSRYRLECWFNRAIAWRPDDNIVRMIFADYLAKMKRINEAELQLKFADAQAKDNAFTHHNIGLIYFDMKNYAQALAQAHKAYSLGLNIPTLKEQLKSVNQWSEPM